MGNTWTDITDAIERFEQLEYHVGIQLRALSAFVSRVAPDEGYELEVHGELLLLMADGVANTGPLIQLMVSLYDGAGRVIMIETIEIQPPWLLTFQIISISFYTPALPAYVRISSIGIFEQLEPHFGISLRPITRFMAGPDSAEDYTLQMYHQLLMINGDAHISPHIQMYGVLQMLNGDANTGLHIQLMVSVYDGAGRVSMTDTIEIQPPWHFTFKVVPLTLYMRVLPACVRISPIGRIDNDPQYSRQGYPHDEKSG